jgi:hypothetical protein
MAGDFIIVGIAFAGGYAASIYTWGWIKSAVLGIENEAVALKAEIDKLKGQIASTISTVKSKLP